MSATPTDTALNDPDPRRWIALATLLIAGFMNLIDITIVNVALPSIEAGLGANSSQIEWVVAGYVLAFALGLLPLGRLGDILGRRKIFLAGVASFSVLSALCGLAPNIETLVVARVLQGFAGAMMMPQVMAITQNIFPPEERAKAFSMFGLSISLAAVTGPLIGGLLVTADIYGSGWRPIFLINVPIGIVAVAAGLRLIPPIAPHRGLRNDVLGIILAAASVFLLIFPLVEGRSYGWPVWSFAMMAAALPAAFLFVLWERMRARADKSQLLPVSLMINRNYLTGVLVILAFFSGIPGFFMILALFLQQGFGFSPLLSGLTTIPFPLGVMSASFVAGRMGARWLKPRLVIGALLVTTGMVLTREVVLAVTDSIDPLIFAAPLFIAGLGMGTTIAVLFQAVLSTVPGRDTGSGSGALQAFQQMGGAIGLALIGQVFFSILAAGGQPGPDRFVAAAGSAMIYDVAVFSAVVILTLWLKTGGNMPGHSRRSPAPIEA